MPADPLDSYLRYAELTRLLQDYAAAHPQLLQLSSLGRSYEGREIWLATITHRGSGDAAAKPALWVDANIHSAELVSSMAALHLIDRLLNGYGSDADITRCLETRAFYICPRVNPDGAEWALADTPRLVRSSTRPWPRDEALVEGLQVQDMDGDGRILSMRIPDPNGPWKINPHAPRLLTRRDPTETGGDYYRLLPEGMIENYDGVTLPAVTRKQNLDLNRNFPIRWRGEHEQKGAGPFPTSEPEVHALVEFVGRHPNICSGISLHSYSGVMLRPFSFRPDDKMPAEDRWVYDTLGAKGTALTGYPAVSAYHEFRYHPQEVITGAMDDWLYAELGRYAWTVELWSPRHEAGIDTGNFIDWYREHPPEDDLKLLAWSDAQLQGRGYVDWYGFDHPQLGPVELGGWDALFSIWNPPPALLQQEIAPLSEWLIWHNLVSPKLELLQATAERVGEGLWRVRCVAQNTGWLPTDVTRLARKSDMVRGVVCEIDLPAGADVVQGDKRTVCGQLEGRSHKSSSPNLWIEGAVDPTDDRVKAEWLVRATAGMEVGVSVRHDRAGSARQTIKLA